MYTIFLLDDEPVFLSTFREALEQHLSTLPQAYDVYAFTCIHDFSEKMTQITPDLIIADIRLADEQHSGITFLETLRKNGCKSEIIFLTAYLQYARDIFDLRPLYFILKNEYSERIPDAIALFLDVTSARKSKVTLHAGTETYVLETNNIMYIERCLRKTIVHCVDKNITISATLSEINQLLPGKGFAYSHQSVLINLMFVKSFNNTDLMMTNGEKLPISRSCAKRFSQSLSSYLYSI